VSAEFSAFPSGQLPTHAADFTLDPAEVAKGGAAASSYLRSIKDADARKPTEEALEIVALLMSNGVCDKSDFPWQQVRSHHAQAALSLLKQEGTPSRVESIRCQRDQNRRFQPVPTTYSTTQLQKARSSLHRVLMECRDLGFISELECDRTIHPPKTKMSRSSRLKPFNYGEMRALVATSARHESAAGARDSLLFYLLFHGALKLSELLSLAVQDLLFDQELQLLTLCTGKTTKRAPKNGKRPAKKSKSANGSAIAYERVVPLPNEALIALEDWLEVRGAEDGPLLCPTKKSGRVEQRRMTGEEVRTICQKRAVQAGVEFFTLEDLRKGALAAQESQQDAASAEQAYNGASVVPSALYGGQCEDEAALVEGRIYFPYMSAQERN